MQSNLNDSTHKVLGEVETTVVSARTEQWGESLSIDSYHHRRVHPCDEVIGEFAAIPGNQSNFVLVCRLRADAFGRNDRTNAIDDVAIFTQPYMRAQVDCIHELPIVLPEEA